MGKNIKNTCGFVPVMVVAIIMLIAYGLTGYKGDQDKNDIGLIWTSIYSPGLPLSPNLEDKINVIKDAAVRSSELEARSYIVYCDVDDVTYIIKTGMIEGMKKAANDNVSVLFRENGKIPPTTYIISSYFGTMYSNVAGIIVTKEDSKVVYYAEILTKEV